MLTANGQNQVESLNNLVQLIDINSKNSSENDEFENIENENIEPWSFEKSEYGHNDPGHNYGQNDPVNSDFGHNDAGYNDAVHSNTANNEVLVCNYITSHLFFSFSWFFICILIVVNTSYFEEARLRYRVCLSKIHFYPNPLFIHILHTPNLTFKKYLNYLAYPKVHNTPHT